MKTLKTSWKHMRRNPYQTLAAVSIMVLTFLAISVFAFIIVGSSAVIQHFESQPQVTAFFKDEATQSNMNELQNSLRASGQVSNIKFVSKEEALQIYKQQNKSDPLLLDLVTEDILPASLEVSTNKIEELGPVFGHALNDLHMSQKLFIKEILSASLTTWTNALRTIGISLIIVLALVSVFIMMTVIGFKVSQKREEIEIMKLLSATNWYIRWPFILEGVCYGVIGTFLGWFLAAGALLYATPFLESFLKGIPVLPISPLFLFGLLFIELLIAVILGVIASYLAVLRYLK